MRIANHGGRALIVVDMGGIDVGQASEGRWDGSPAALFDDWPAFRSWASPIGDR